MKIFSIIIQKFYQGIQHILYLTHSTQQFSIREALVLYYWFLPIPAVFILLAGAFGLLMGLHGQSYATFWSPHLSQTAGFASSSSVYTTLFALVCSGVFVLTAFINAAIYHAIGKFVVRAWLGGSFPRTFAAVALGMLPVALLFFILSLPLINPQIRAVVNALFTVMYIWSGIVTWLSLAAQHRVNKWRALVAYIIGTCVVLVTLTFYINIEITVSIWKEML